MEIRADHPPVVPYRFADRERGEKEVHADRVEVAAAIDANHDHFLDDGEIKEHMRKVGVLRDPNLFHTDVEQLVDDFKVHLQKEVLPQAEGYHTFDQIHAELEQLATAHPDRARLVSLGKTGEGRDIWALKISKGADGDTSTKPGVVFTGNHHAREWMSMEVPLQLAKDLVEKYDSDPQMKARVDQAEIWVIPTANPDGYEYSRKEDNWWRKNRVPIMDAGAGNIAGSNLSSGAEAQGAPVAYGVDLNRNYYDGNPDHFALYRPPGDTPGNTWDDFGRATSDDPHADTFRGPSGASEPEVKAMLALELGHPNIRGVIDHHGYGEMILRPWGYTHKSPTDLAFYDEVGKRMRAAQQNPYRYLSATDLYPTSGGSNDVHEANGIIGLTIELGRSFQPRANEFDSIKKNVGAADLAFLDFMIEKFPPGSPPHPPVPPPPYD